VTFLIRKILLLESQVTIQRFLNIVIKRRDTIGLAGKFTGEPQISGKSNGD